MKGLSTYVHSIIADESNRCKRFEEGLRREIRTPVTASVKWKEFSKLVEAAMRVEKNLTDENLERDSHRSEHVIHPSGGTGDRSNRTDDMRFMLGVSHKGNFKPRSSGQSTYRGSLDGGMRIQGQGRPGYPAELVARSRSGQPSESIASSVRKPQCGTYGKHHWG